MFAKSIRQDFAPLPTKMRPFATIGAATLLRFAVAGNHPYSGTFADPASSERVFFRYWVPDGGVDPDIVKDDIWSAGSIGAGGIEFVPYFEYGGNVGSMPPGADWAKYNFGTEPFRHLFATALEAHAKNGLLMDFALGPNQGQGVPAAANDEGLQWDLVRSRNQPSLPLIN